MELKKSAIFLGYSESLRYGIECIRSLQLCGRSFWVPTGYPLPPYMVWVIDFAKAHI